MKKNFQEGYINNVREDDIIHSLNVLRYSPLYLTKPVQRYNSSSWPNNEMPFVEFHLGYLKSHPTLDPWQYLANLKLSLKIRSA